MVDVEKIGEANGRDRSRQRSIPAFARLLRRSGRRRGGRNPRRHPRSSCSRASSGGNGSCKATPRIRVVASLNGSKVSSGVLSLEPSIPRRSDGRVSSGVRSRSRDGEGDDSSGGRVGREELRGRVPQSGRRPNSVLSDLSSVEDRSCSCSSSHPGRKRGDGLRGSGSDALSSKDRLTKSTAHAWNSGSISLLESEPVSKETR